MSDVHVFNAEKLVTVVTPQMSEDWHVFALRVVCMDYDEALWAVTRYHQYLGTDGTWSWRNGIDDEWRASHYLPHDEAVALAQKYAPEVKVNGHHAQRVADHWLADQVTEWGEENQPNG